jgi:hypothetical protein
LNSVDLPTFGRPAMTTVGSAFMIGMVIRRWPHEAKRNSLTAPGIATQERSSFLKKRGKKLLSRSVRASRNARASV